MHNASANVSNLCYFGLSLDNPANAVFEICGYPWKDTLLIKLLYSHELIYCLEIT